MNDDKVVAAVSEKFGRYNIVYRNELNGSITAAIPSVLGAMVNAATEQDAQAQIMKLVFEAAIREAISLTYLKAADVAWEYNDTGTSGYDTALSIQSELRRLSDSSGTPKEKA